MPKVLICDDSLSVRKVAERLLLAAGFDVELAANGEEALAGLTAGQPDIIIADVIMPDKSGFEVCAHVRAHATLSMTPVLLISGIVDDDITRQALECHADGVIKKPFHGSSLQDRVLALLASRQAQPATVESSPVEMPNQADNGKTQAAGNGKTLEPPEAGWGLKVFRITEDQLEKVRDVAIWAKDVETRLNEEQKRSSELGEQNAAFRETALSAAACIQQLEIKLAEEQKQSAVLVQRIAELEPAASSVSQLKINLAEEQKRSAVLLERIAEIEPAAARAEKLADIIEEIVKLGPKSRH
ncbi:MAG: response regulator [Nitrospirota bacterium]